jgi:hypothetical protein
MAATIPTNGIALSSGLNVADGDITMASGHGISFAATSNSSAGSNITELLSDYEEGTWTIGLTDGTGDAITTSTNLGQYQLIGNQVFIKGYVVASSLNSGTGNVNMTGLPFTAQNNANYYNGVNISYRQNFNITAGQSCVGYVVINTTQAWMGLEDTTTGATELQCSELSDNGGFMFNAHYTLG